MRIDTSLLNIGAATFFTSSHGDCMDSQLSPLQVHEGDVIGMHEIKTENLRLYKHKLVAVILRSGHRLIKELAGMYETTSFCSDVQPSKGVILKCYNPKPTQMYFPMEDIQRAFAVDCAYPKTSIKFIE